jgi:hypothetical protein
VQRRLFERLNRFKQHLLYEWFGSSDDDRDRKIDVRLEAQRQRDIAPVTELLRSACPVRRKVIAGPKARLAMESNTEADILNRFQRLKDLVLPDTLAQTQKSIEELRSSEISAKDPVTRGMTPVIDSGKVARGNLLTDISYDFMYVHHRPRIWIVGKVTPSSLLKKETSPQIGQR